jgi:PAS domain S-box-containing protein
MRCSVHRLRACLLAGALLIQVPAAAVLIGDYLNPSGASAVSADGRGLAGASAGPAERPRHSLALLASFGVIPIIAASGALELMLARHMRRVTETARQLARGDFTRPLPQSALVEVQTLSDTFREIGDAMERRVAESVAALSSVSRAKNRFRELVDQIHDGVYQHTLDGQYLMVNRRLAVLLGYESVEQLQSEFSWDAHTKASEREKYLKDVDAAGEVINVERVLRRRDGTALTVLESSRLVPAEGDAPAYYQGTIVDITERKRIETELEHSQRLEAVGRLAGAVAHDFNNLLTVIFACADEALERADWRDSATEIREIQIAAERAAALTRQLLAFSRQQVLEPRVVDLNVALGGVEQLVRRLVGEDIEVATSGDTALRPVMLDPHQFEQVIVNLAANARDAMPTGGRLTMWTTAVRLASAVSHSGFSIPAGEYAELSIQDSGVGIPADIKERIFEPFFSTKGSRGTGLGLATVYGIVKQSGGFIVVESEPAQGTTFRMYFPITASVAEERTAGASRPAPAKGTQTLLVVEDEESVRTLVSAGLRRSGYNVVEASRPSEALELAQSIARLDMILTDLVLPDMNGRALAARLLECRPEARVLFMSGYAEADLMARGMLSADASFLQKPFSWQDLTASVHKVLNQPGEPAAYLASA